MSKKDLSAPLRLAAMHDGVAPIEDRRGYSLIFLDLAKECNPGVVAFSAASILGSGYLSLNKSYSGGIDL